MSNWKPLKIHPELCGDNLKEILQLKAVQTLGLGSTVALMGMAGLLHFWPSLFPAATGTAQ